MLRTFDLSVNGVRSRVYDSGPAARSEAVVFVHGNPGPLDDWEELAPEVATFARAVAMDLPAFGRAERPRRFDFSVAGYARHLAGLLNQLGVNRAHLVLHDFGGFWGLHWAKDHPEALASLTLIDVPIAPGYEWHTFARLWQTPLVGELLQLLSGNRSIRAVMNRDNPRPLPTRFTERVLKYADLKQKLAVLKIYRRAKDAGATLAELELGAARSLPTCVIWGAQDKYVPVTHAQELRPFFPLAEVHVLERCGHWPFVDEPRAVSRILTQFLRRHVTPAHDAEREGAAPLSVDAARSKKE